MAPKPAQKRRPRRAPDAADAALLASEPLAGLGALPGNISPRAGFARKNSAVGSSGLEEMR